MYHTRKEKERKEKTTKREEEEEEEEDDYDNDTARGIILGMFEKMMEIKRSRFFLVLGV